MLWAGVHPHGDATVLVRGMLRERRGLVVLWRHVVFLVASFMISVFINTGAQINARGEESRCYQCRHNPDHLFREIGGRV